ncbi:hypothetical protein BDW60DRAFT_195918 [Aspergillus nidulans var. acristatus]
MLGPSHFDQFDRPCSDDPQNSGPTADLFGEDMPISRFQCGRQRCQPNPNDTGQFSSLAEVQPNSGGRILTVLPLIDIRLIHIDICWERSRDNISAMRWSLHYIVFAVSQRGIAIASHFARSILTQCPMYCYLSASSMDDTSICIEPDCRSRRCMDAGKQIGKKKMNE